MLRRIRQFFRDPILPPPQRSWLARNFVWVIAVALNAVLVLAVSTAYNAHVDYAQSLSSLSPALYMIGLSIFGLFMLAPLVVAVSGFRMERQRRTLESLVLLPADRGRIVRTRLLRAGAPWLVFMLAMVPVYVLLSWAISTEEPEVPALSSVMTKPVLLLALCMGGELLRFGSHGHLVRVLWMTPLSMLNDGLLLACGVMAGLSASLRATSTLRAAGRGLLCGTLPMLTLLSVESWMIYLLIEASLPREQGTLSLMVLVPLAAGLRAMFLIATYRRLVRNFDRYALGDGAGP